MSNMTREERIDLQQYDERPGDVTVYHSGKLATSYHDSKRCVHVARSDRNGVREIQLEFARIRLAPCRNCVLSDSPNLVPKGRLDE